MRNNYIEGFKNLIREYELLKNGNVPNDTTVDSLLAWWGTYGALPENNPSRRESFIPTATERTTPFWPTQL